MTAQIKPNQYGINLLHSDTPLSDDEILKVINGPVAAVENFVQEHLKEDEYTENVLQKLSHEDLVKIAKRWPGNRDIPDFSVVKKEHIISLILDSHNGFDKT